MHAVDVTKQGDILFLQMSRGEQAVFSAALLPDNRVHLVFDPAQGSTPLSGEDFARLVQKPKKEPVHPPITLEGYPVRVGKYNKDEKTNKQTYSLTIRPDGFLCSGQCKAKFGIALRYSKPCLER